MAEIARIDLKCLCLGFDLQYQAKRTSSFSTKMTLYYRQFDVIGGTI